MGTNENMAHFRVKRVPAHMIRHLPGKPSGIKIVMTDGVQLCWDSPKKEKVREYSVFMAVRGPSSQVSGEDKSNIYECDQLQYFRIYKGAGNKCAITKEHISSAYLHKTDNYGFIFRIAAKNERGYGPAIPVKWVVDQ
ncbi:host cell factor homolog hcf-1-like isoform X2 [Schistocerca gregaria]|uniref:host cell factor homolog hcf-1-like isoform X2 n=1 Tax=Schistocerca gregaria TaxID=7010 RepID=UPI00211DB88D|nr:host cell factor homolog hcf-1-like isoform X2 [Schistocerca gregaria]